MIDQGSSELNIIVGVDGEEFEAAVRAIYGAFVGGGEKGRLIRITVKATLPERPGAPLFAAFRPLTRGARRVMMSVQLF